MEKEETKNVRITFRMYQSQREKWKKICSEKGLSLTELIESSVENKITSVERRDILKFIENQDNIFAKIENNINQFARIANSKKDINSQELRAFTERLLEIQKLKAKQNEIIKEIYKLIANGS